jgi:hypothetical protein
MDLKNWCEYIRDVMDKFSHLTIAYVAKEADVSQKRIELIRAIRDDQDILRATARRIEQVVLGPATNHICDMDFDKSAAEKIEQLQSKIEQLEEDAKRYKKIIDKFMN